MKYSTKTSLKRSSHETCDFCEKTFNNKYDLIVHNATHIIIPLININWPQYDKCLQFYTSENDVLGHHSIAHSKVSESLDIPSNREESAINNIHKAKRSFQERIVFENDNNDLHLLSKFTTDCKVNVEYFDPPHYQAATAVDDIIIIDDDFTIDALDNKVNECDDFRKTETNFSRRCEILDNMVVFQPRGFKETISYDALKRPGIIKCQHCSKSFPNRFTAIEHEASHIKFKKIQPQVCLFCDKYVAGSLEKLTKHVIKYHPHKQLENYYKSICKKCGYQYRQYKQHVKFYHHLECYICYKQFQSDSELAQHFSIHYQQESTFQVCDLCLQFYKPKKYLKYEIVDRINVSGERQTCSSCGRMFFGVFLVKRKIFKSFLTYDFDFKQPKTNKQRLKNIQKRLKKMKF